MKEFSTQAIVLDKQDLGEADARVFLYSPDYGKIIGKIKSSKKIISKLNAHLEPFNLVTARVIDRGPQIVDALLIEKLKPSWPLAKFLNFIKEISFEGQVDYYFWSLIKRSLVSGKINYQQLLASQGFDPQFAVCHNCQKDNPSLFYFNDHSFWCKNCVNNQKSMINDQGLKIANLVCSSGFIELS